MDQSSPDLFHVTQEELPSIFQILDILSRSGDIRDQSRRLYEIDRNFACFWPPNFFWGGEFPEFLESIYKIDTGFDHVAKFRGDRPRELGDYALKKRNITSIL